MARPKDKKISTPMVLALASGMATVGIAAFYAIEIPAELAEDEAQRQEYAALVIDDRTPERVAESYLDAWRCVGSMMGVRVDLIPTTVAEAQALTAQIQARQIDPSDEGREMTAALLGMMEANLPVPGSAAISSGLMRSSMLT